ncbi:MAG: hypothetical protein IKS49_07530 [Actinomycetaceae bacterium]|nr:hypothetical protein [Actinomycetaceae bacterium]
MQVGDDGAEHFDGWRYPVFSRDDFEGAWPEIQEFQAFLQKYPRLSDMSFPIVYYAENANEIEQQADAFLFDYTIGIKLSSTHKDFLDQLYKSQANEKEDFGIVDEYLKDCLKLGLRSRIDEFSDEEIARIVKASVYMEPVRDYYTEKVLNPAVVFDVGAYPPRLAYGHLFELAQAAGLHVEGTWAQFVVNGADGQEHAFAYKYIEYNKGDGFVKQEVAEKVLGFKIDTYQEWVDRTITADMLAYVGMSPQELVNHLEANAEGRKVTTKIVDGDVQIHAKRGALLSASDAYLDEANKLEEQVRKTSGTDFHFRLRDYMSEENDVEMVLYSEKDVTGENTARVEKIVKLLYLREQFFDPGEPFHVSMQKSNGSDVTEIATFEMSDDDIDISKVWR